jgi:hypothetical protein
MTTASDGGAQRRTAHAAGAQARRRRHRQRITQAQLDFFSAAAPGDPLFGVAVKLPETCSKCGGLVATVGPGKPPHSASVLCRPCGLHRGWISCANYTFLNEVINKFGAPSEPIVFRSRSTKPEENGDGVSVVQDGMIKEKPHASDS